MDGLTDDVITLVANTLAAVTDTWEDAVGHPTERKDRVQEREDTCDTFMPSWGCPQPEQARVGSKYERHSCTGHKDAKKSRRFCASHCLIQGISMEYKDLRQSGNYQIDSDLVWYCSAF